MRVKDSSYDRLSRFLEQFNLLVSGIEVIVFRVGALIATVYMLVKILAGK